MERVVEEEFDVYKATKSIDFMLLQTYLREWEKENGIQCGYGRGSVSGSMIAYLLGDYTNGQSAVWVELLPLYEPIPCDQCRY